MYKDVIALVDVLLSEKDPFNHHGINVSKIALLIAERLELDKEQMELLECSARLHDMGKILITDSLLNETRPLTRPEKARMQAHVTLGYDILKSLNYDKQILDGILYHHEHYDGTGYLAGLSGDNIPLFARIISIGDVWDAITNQRAYHNARNKEDALIEMEKVKAWFDPNIYSIFIETIEGQCE